MQGLKHRITHLLFEVFLFLLGLIVLIPLATVVLSSFKTFDEAALFNLTLPTSLSFENYIKVIETSDVARSLINGLIYCLFSAGIVIVLTSLASFVLSRSKAKGLIFLYNVFIAGLVLPASIIPTIILTKQLHIYGTYFNLIMIYAAFNIPLSILLYTGFIKTIPVSLDEAVIIDGGGPFKVFLHVIFPLLKPVHMTALLIIITGVWNDFFFQLYFATSSKMRSMPLTIYNYFSLYSRSWNLVCANIVISILPMVVLYLVFQKYIVDGMTVGAVKG